MKLSVCKIFEFSAAHHLPAHEGKCQNPHGHTYRLEVEVVNHPDPITGMVIDYYDLSSLVSGRIMDFLDHADLNDKMDNPTTENLVFWIKTRLQEMTVLRDILNRIRLWESTTSYCEWRRGEEV